ncbi:MAG: hypothetical protein Q4B22_01620 [Eubacteriales bacterium]|nr:hypothetical protein [Eubacteriales bacterium]
MKKKTLAALLVCSMLAAAVPVYAEETESASSVVYVDEYAYSSSDMESNLESQEYAADNAEYLLEADSTEEIDLLGAGTVSMYRMYNPNSGEHFYTASKAEKENLCKAGWRYEGIGWIAPANNKKAPVYRMYNSNAGDHHYTLSVGEKNHLTSLGWKYEGIGWYSDTTKTVPLYRAYNPNANAGSHNYTTSAYEQKNLTTHSWKDEGIAWYALKGGSPLPARQFRIVVNDDENDLSTGKARVSKYRPFYVHCSMTGGDNEHTENYTIHTRFPDGTVKSQSIASNQNHSFFQKISTPNPQSALSGECRSWLTDSSGAAVAEVSFTWGA